MEDYYSKYLKYKYKYIKLKNGMIGGGENKEVSLILIKAEWCGHCKKFLPVWNTIQKDDKYKNLVNYVTLDEKNDTEEIKKYKIEGYPTILVNSNDKIHEYKGNKDIEGIIELLESIREQIN